MTKTPDGSDDESAWASVLPPETLGGNVYSSW